MYFQQFQFIQIIAGLEELKIKKTELTDIVYREEAERVVLEKNIKALQEKLNNLNQSLENHKNLYESYEKTIRETENGFKKVFLCKKIFINFN